MTDNLLVSVIIPTYDRPALLERAIGSVVDQTYESIELIVVDDHSPRPAAPVVEAAETDSLTAVRCLRHDENRGGSAARTTGIEAAEGSYVAFLDDDDEWESPKLRRQVERVESASEDVTLVYTGIRQVGPDGTTNAIKTPTIEGDILERLLRGNFIGSYSAVLVTADAIDAAGLPDERFPSWQDWEWYLRLAQEGAFVSVPKPLVVRYSEHAQVSADFATKRDVSYPLLLERGRPIAQACGLEREFEASAAFHLAWAALRNERYGTARQCLLRSLRQDPTNTSAWLYLLLTLGGRFTFRPAQRVKREVVRVANG